MAIAPPRQTGIEDLELGAVFAPQCEAGETASSAPGIGRVALVPLFYGVRGAESVVGALHEGGFDFAESDMLISAVPSTDFAPAVREADQCRDALAAALLRHQLPAQVIRVTEESKATTNPYKGFLATMMRDFGEGVVFDSAFGAVENQPDIRLVVVTTLGGALRAAGIKGNEAVKTRQAMPDGSVLLQENGQWVPRSVKTDTSQILASASLPHPASIGVSALTYI